jgi:hypothetical protein
VYTSETRGSDESGEGTYRVPFKTVMKVLQRPANDLHTRQLDYD